MYMRFLQVTVRPEVVQEFHRFYEATIVPSLQETPGCVFASLLQSANRDTEHLSLTLWESQKAAESYHQGPTYSRLLNQSDPFLEESTEWKLRLSEDQSVQYDAVLKDPEVEGYLLEDHTDEATSGHWTVSSLFVRIVSVRLEAGRFEDFRKRYDEVVLPTLHRQPGCRAAFLLEGISDPDRAVSVSVWEREEDALRYERNGTFDDLTDQLKDTFSQLYQWRIGLVSSAEPKQVSSRDLDVARYSIVAGHRFGG